MNFEIKTNEEPKHRHSIQIVIDFDDPKTEDEAREWVKKAISTYGFCERASDALNEKIAEAQTEKAAKDDEGQAAVVKENEPAKKIDWNKACALKTAGWSNDDIAREVGAKKSTIATCIVEKMSLYKTGHRF